MVVYSGATDNHVDPALTRSFGAYMRDVDELRVPHTIVAAGQNILQGVAAGTICGAVTDDSGNDRLISFRVIVVCLLYTSPSPRDRG